MGILTGITGAVRANIAGFANQAIASGTDRIKSIAGLTREGANSSDATLSSLSKSGGGTNILTYPINVVEDEQQGHYILFEINKRIDGNLGKNKNKKGVGQVVKNMADELIDQENFQIPRGGGAAEFKRGDGAESDSFRQQVMDFGGGPNPSELKTVIRKSDLMDNANGRTNRSIAYERIPTVRHHTTIALYMPPSLQVTYDVKYGDNEISGLAGAFGDAIAAFSATPGNTITKLQGAFDGGMTGFNELAQSFAMGTLDTFAEGAQTLMQHMPPPSLVHACSCPSPC